MLFARVISYIWFGRVCWKKKCCLHSVFQVATHFSSIVAGLGIWNMCISLKLVDLFAVSVAKTFVSIPQLLPAIFRIIILHNEFLDSKSDTWRIFYRPFFLTPMCWLRVLMCECFFAWILWFSDRDFVEMISVACSVSSVVPMTCLHSHFWSQVHFGGIVSLFSAKI